MREERKKSDREVRLGNGTAATVADAVVEQARDDADEVLRAARETEPQPDLRQAHARAEHDAAIQRSRAAADVKLDDERAERTRAMAALFALERELTDQHLMAERDRADLVVHGRDEFLGMVAHDLRGFMGEIAFRAAMLVSSAGSDEAGLKTRKIGERIQRSTAAMNRLVGDLLDVAAIEAGKLRVEVAEGDLSSVLRDSAEAFRSAAEANGIAFVLEEIEDQVTAVFDHDRVVQVLGNLVNNAIKFSPTGSRISLRLTVAGEAARITVTDAGEGIAADKLETIFQRFTQIRADRRGLGLGLYISRCLIEAQRGRIWAASTPGAGSEFSLTLPLAR